ncbi:MAG: hypothetical protein DA408_17410 [Bacteroidetes bacterium]|nr:MAG: hypothetical protein C7N36_14050 [Bacteroidota bacterium]PTM09884.1 MAG: hypothetical protein DA408_17410 [Bacteroidota bacterium]
MKSAIGERIKTIRQEKKMQQQEVAKLLNISQSTYAKIEQGAIKIDAERILALAKIFEVEYDKLLPPYPDKNINFTNNQMTNGFVEQYYAASKESNEKQIEQLMEVIRSITQSQAKTQAANQQLLEQIKELRAINEQLRQEIRGGKG